MLQHVPDDAVGAPAVLRDLLKIAGQHLHDLVDICALVVGERSQGRFCRFFELVEQFDRKPGEVVDEIERVLDLMGDAGGQLA